MILTDLPLQWAEYGRAIAIMLQQALPDHNRECPLRRLLRLQVAANAPDTTRPSTVGKEAK